jgi:hypothetical protein
VLHENWNLIWICGWEDRRGRGSSRHRDWPETLTGQEGAVLKVAELSGSTVSSCGWVKGELRDRHVGQHGWATQACAASSGHKRVLLG